MAKSRLPKKEKAGESTVETLSARQDNLLGWSLWPLLWHFMERQPVVMGLPGTHISCLAFVLLPSSGCLIIYPWYDNLPHDLFHKQSGREAAGEKGRERDWRGKQKSPSVTFHQPPILTLSSVTASVRNYRTICCSCCSFICLPREHSSLYLPLCVNTLYPCEYSWPIWEWWLWSALCCVANEIISSRDD